LQRCAAASPDGASAAIAGLAMIGGRDAALAVSEMIERAVVQGPTLQIAVSAAARLGSALSPDALRQLMRHAEPGIRADACRCARPLPELILIDLLDDLDRRVATSVASALGRKGRIEARPILKSLLRDDPSEDAIDAVSSIADEECAVLLGRIARSRSVLADASLISLENADHVPCGRHCGCDPAVPAVTAALGLRSYRRRCIASNPAPSEALSRPLGP
jgi:hypothetical protein